MLFIDKPEEFRRPLPGFLPTTAAGRVKGAMIPAEFTALPHPMENLVRRMCGSTYQSFVSSNSTEVTQRGFWDWWILVARAPDSQYDLLRQVIGDDGDLPGHVVCLALEGAGFHGQQDRGWAAARGNLHLTVGLRCDLDAARCALALTMLPAVAVVEALTALGAGRGQLPEVGIKWVNDVMIQEQKVGGVLTSARSQNGRIKSVVLGIGLNVAATPKVEPTTFTPAVTCLDDHIPPGAMGFQNVLEAVLGSLARRFAELGAQGPGPLLKAYRSASVIMGRQVEVRPDDGPVRRGRVLKIGPDLTLTLSDHWRPVTAGRLILLPEPTDPA